MVSFLDFLPTLVTTRSATRNNGTSDSRQKNSTKFSPMRESKSIWLRIPNTLIYKRQLSSQVDQWTEKTNDRGIESELEILRKQPPTVKNKP